MSEPTENSRIDPDLALTRELSRTERQIDLLLDQMVDLSGIVKEIASSRGQSQTVVHKTQGIGGWASAAVVACFATWVVIILSAIYFVPTLHDLNAWEQILNTRITKLESTK
jgi:hypothetical protein